ncbi:MAG: glycosyltransferase family 9 protein [Desulfobacteraceae bacterium]
MLILTFNGWGDCILVQPVYRALYEKVSETGEAPEISLAGSWVKNFPYKGASFISKIIPNHMTLDELANYDVIVNLVRVNEARGNGRSIKDLYLEALGLGGEDLPPPVIVPDEERVERLKPLINKIRQQIGKRILYLNWRSRFIHKSAPAELFFQVAEKLKGDYQAVLFKDQEEAGIMGKEIREHRAPVQNLSTWIRDLKDTVAAISLVDAVISVDTGIVHAAGALGVSCVAVFGPFSSQGHVDSYPRVKGIRSGYQGKTCTGPCGETHRGCREIGFEKGRYSPCIETLTAETIIQALKELQ